MRKYHSLMVSKLRHETADSVRLSMTVPEEHKSTFKFQAGQHLPLQALIDNQRVRRTYSICSAPNQMPLELGIRVQPGGQFSEFVANELRVGDTLDVMPPFGRFHAEIAPQQAKTYLLFAAGSGITPILSIIRATLADEPNSRIVLFYGNRRQRTTMFIDDLYALKNQHAERLQLYFLFSQEEQEFDVFSGRLDEQKVRHLLNTFCVGLSPDDAFICGPDTMIDSVRNALIDFGMEADAIHTERYGAPRKTTKPSPSVSENDEKQATVNVILDGHQKSFEMSLESGNIVDAAAEQGIDLPYSCKGGVCATCRTHVRSGEVHMATNYGLEPWEVEKGFVLACQSRPSSDEVTIDYDIT